MKKLKNPISDITVAKRLVYIKSSADDRNIKFDLSFRKLKSILENPVCFYTGVDLVARQGNNQLTIDRIDSSGAKTPNYIRNIIFYWSHYFASTIFCIAFQ